MHGNLLKTRLLADGFHDTASQILLRVRHYHDAGARRMRENVMGTLHPVEYPTGFFDLPDQVRAVHGVYGTHSNVGEQAFSRQHVEHPGRHPDQLNEDMSMATRDNADVN